MMPWDVIDAARTEISDAYRNFATIDARLADDFYSIITTRTSQARDTPKLYRIRRNHVRRINLGPRFKEWYLAYMIWNGTFIVLARGHGKRKPFYFFKRVAEAKRLHA